MSLSLTPNALSECGADTLGRAPMACCGLNRPVPVLQLY
jgi:hypothetical protein